MKKIQLSNEELIWIGVDFDKTIAHNSGHPDFILGGPIDGARDALLEIEKRGLKVIIYTSRHWSDYINIENWMKMFKMPYSRIILGKPLFKYYVGDEAIGFRGDWNDVLKQIK